MPNSQLAAEPGVDCQIPVTKPFRAEVTDGHATAKTEESVVRADRNSPGERVAKFPQNFGWQASRHMLFNDFTDRLRDFRPARF
jgi:hypothetical protein